MKIKTKLTYGIGILFILILILGVVAGKYITDMSTGTRNILADNDDPFDDAFRTV